MSSDCGKAPEIPPPRPLIRSELGAGFTAILDATPLIRLSQAQLLPRLETAFHLAASGRMLIITQSVWDEAITPGKPEYEELRDWLLRRTQPVGIFPVHTFLDQRRDQERDENPGVNPRERGDGEKASLEMLEETSFPDALFVCDDKWGRNQAKRRNARVMGVRSFARVIDEIDPSAAANSAIEGLASEVTIKAWDNDSPLL